MIHSYTLYQSQYKKAKETLDMLERQKAEIHSKLETNPICSILNKELRTANLEIKITENELEQAEADIQKCELQYNQPNL